MSAPVMRNNENGSIIIISLITIVVVSVAGLSVFQSARQAMQTAQLNWNDCQTSLMALSVVNEEINSIDDAFIRHYNSGTRAKQLSKFEWFSAVNYSAKTLGDSSTTASDDVYHFGVPKVPNVPSLESKFSDLSERIRYSVHVEKPAISDADLNQLDVSLSTEKLAISVNCYLVDESENIVYKNTRIHSPDTGGEGTIRAFTAFGADVSNIYDNAMFGNNKVWFDGPAITVNGAVRSNADIVIGQYLTINTDHEKVVASKPTGNQLLMVSGGFESKDTIDGTISKGKLGQWSNWAVLGMSIGDQVFKFRQMTDEQYNVQTSAQRPNWWSGLVRSGVVRPDKDKVPLKNSFDE